MIECIRLCVILNYNIDAIEHTRTNRNELKYTAISSCACMLRPVLGEEDGSGVLVNGCSCLSISESGHPWQMFPRGLFNLHINSELHSEIHNIVFFFLSFKKSEYFLKLLGMVPWCYGLGIHLQTIHKHIHSPYKLFSILHSQSFTRLEQMFCAWILIFHFFFKLDIQHDLLKVDNFPMTSAKLTQAFHLRNLFLPPIEASIFYARQSSLNQSPLIYFVLMEHLKKVQLGLHNQAQFIAPVNLILYKIEGYLNADSLKKSMYFAVFILEYFHISHNNMLHNLCKASNEFNCAITNENLEPYFQPLATVFTSTPPNKDLVFFLSGLYDTNKQAPKSFSIQSKFSS
ncbi:uncharacterized protein VP01_1987g2 [Puccinia sorghi]|uniref:Uncharacterized protein n=1 Tax=Puccinia sorghi TaxID=27349 RepID=A0A0L6VBN5_9BASI|nr:uncharacterized protein VP01_1987g2 [Puccinia sorghi]